MAKKKIVPSAKPKIDLRPRIDETEEPEDRSTFRILPYPNIAALAQFQILGMKPPDINQVFLSVCIGPNTGDMHALACVGVFPIKGQESAKGVEILNAFALSDSAYVALSEAIRAVLMPFGYRSFEGDVNMLSATEPIRVIGHKPFYEHVDPNQRKM